MYNKDNVTFTTTIKKSEETKPMTEQLEMMGKGYKKMLIQRIIIAAASLAKTDKKAVQKICEGKFRITLI